MKSLIHKLRSRLAGPHGEARHAREALLREVFPGITDAELARIDAATTVITVADGRQLCEEGAAGLEAMILLDGDVEVAQSGSVIATRHAPSLLGELAATDRVESRTASVRAVGPVTVAVAHRGEFSSLVSSCPAIAQRIDALAASRLDAA